MNMHGCGVAIAEEAEVERVPAIPERPDPVAVVRAVLALPDDQLDYARAKLAFDAAIDPSTDTQAVLAELDRMAQLARQMAGPGADSARKLDALRALIYKSGPWNGFRPFDYDFDNFKDLRVKLISRYLETRLGNCVTMPILFLILGDKIGLHLSLAAAPVHLYLRHRDESGHTISLEPTSGALFARECWVREQRQVTDRGIESGLYMRSLSRREGVAAMALIVVEHLVLERRFAEAIAITELLIGANARDAMAWANQSWVYYRPLLRLVRGRPPTAARAPWLSEPTNRSSMQPPA
jgi:regulator of sirC expression with transglutaminase-like and TPR domain